MTARNVLIALVGATIVIGTAACGTSNSTKPGPASETVTTPPATSVASAPATTTPSATPTIMTTANSVCVDLAGNLGADQVCTVHVEATDYSIDMKFPTDYPDLRALSAVLTRERDRFVQAVTSPNQPPYAKSLDITSTTYRSAAGGGTESLVLAEHADYGGAHGVAFFNALNYDLGTKTPITYDALFKPGSNAVAVLDPIVKTGFEKQLPGMPLDDNINGAKTYQNFALTDDAVIFFIDQGEWAVEAAGPQQFSIPRSELASILA